AADRTERRETPEGDMARSLVAVVGRYVARMLSNAELLPVHCVRIETGRRCRRRVSPTGGRNTGSGGRNTGSGGRGALRAPRPPVYEIGRSVGAIGVGSMSRPVR